MHTPPNGSNDPQTQRNLGQQTGRGLGGAPTGVEGGGVNKVQALMNQWLLDWGLSREIADQQPVRLLFPAFSGDPTKLPPAVLQQKLEERKKILVQMISTHPDPQLAKAAGAELYKRMEASVRALQLLHAHASVPAAQGAVKSQVVQAVATPAPVPEASEVLLGGRYELLAELGEGGMGTVYRAKDTKMGRIVVIKMIKSEKTGNPNSAKRFQNEIMLGAALNSPHIITAYDTGILTDEQGQTVPYLVLEYVKGKDLHAVVEERGQLPAREACEYIRQAAVGLHAAHTHKNAIVHRDIKPHNLMLTQGADGKPVVKILDMGLARANETAGLDQRTVTKLGSFVGSPHYAAPEQVTNAHKVTPGADLYSLGATLYYLLSKDTPYHGDDVNAVVFKKMLEPWEPLEAKRADLPPALYKVIQKLLAKDPKDRFQSAQDLIAALEPLCQEPAPVAVPVGTPVAAPQPRVSRLNGKNGTDGTTKLKREAKDHGPVIRRKPVEHQSHTVRNAVILLLGMVGAGGAAVGGYLAMKGGNGTDPVAVRPTDPVDPPTKTEPPVTTKKIDPPDTRPKDTKSETPVTPKEDPAKKAQEAFVRFREGKKADVQKATDAKNFKGLRTIAETYRAEAKSAEPYGKAYLDEAKSLDQVAASIERNEDPKVKLAEAQKKVADLVGKKVEEAEKKKDVMALEQIAESLSGAHGTETDPFMKQALQEQCDAINRKGMAFAREEVKGLAQSGTQLLRGAMTEKGFRQTALLEKAEEMARSEADPALLLEIVKVRGGTASARISTLIGGLADMVGNQKHAEAFAQQKHFATFAGTVFDDSVAAENFLDLGKIVEHETVAVDRLRKLRVTERIRVFNGGRTAAEKNLRAKEFDTMMKDIEDRLVTHGKTAKELELVGRAFEALAKDPKNPEANFAVGSYRCATAKLPADFAKGVDLLALGKGDLAELAKRHKSAVQSAEQKDKLDAAIEWLKRAETTAKGNLPEARWNMRGAAIILHPLLKDPEFKGLPKLQMESALNPALRICGMSMKEFQAGGEGEKVVEVKPPDPEPAIDLAKLIDTRKHAISGNWNVTGEKEKTKIICTTEQQGSKITIPMKIEGSYQLSCDVQQSTGKGAMHLIFPVKDKTVVLVAAYNKSEIKLGDINRQLMSPDEKALKGYNPALGKSIRVNLSVNLQKDDKVKIVISFDGMECYNLENSMSSITDSAAAQYWKVPDRLGVGADLATGSISNLIITKRPN